MHVVAYEYVTCGSALKLLNTGHNVRLHSHDVKYGSGSGQQVAVFRCHNAVHLDAYKDAVCCQKILQYLTDHKICTFCVKRALICSMLNF